jgi:hypothetical protein
MHALQRACGANVSIQVQAACSPCLELLGDVPSDFKSSHVQLSDKHNPLQGAMQVVKEFCGIEGVKGQLRAAMRWFLADGLYCTEWGGIVCVHTGL